MEKAERNPERERVLLITIVLTKRIEIISLVSASLFLRLC